MAGLLELLRGHAAQSPEHVAICAPGRVPLTYRELLAEVEAQAAAIVAAGGGAGRTTAVAMANGPDLALAVLAAIAAGTCAPLATDHPPAQLDRELARLGAKVVVSERGPVRYESAEPAAPAEPVSPADTRPALLLFTSGTTSEPKLVPITEDALLHSAATVAATLRLEASDRCLNVMPLFHIHGLVAGLLASLSAGASVVCTPGFRASDIGDWVDEHRPTWYTAVPTIHQAMLDVARAGDLRGVFRVVRSSSAPLPPVVLAELEVVLEAPVMEAYGMTEAAHQLASNPLPPAVRKPGTVGLPTGVEIAAVDAQGRHLAAGEVGELVVKGRTVTAGYVDNAAANEAAFVDGWFRTGDEGRIDDDGYVTITGRLKELINRGGEKVAPREVDEVLLSHPDVRLAAAFAVPHERLGEEVAAAVVLRDGALTTPAQLRAHVAQRLEPFKVPRRVVQVDDIPRGPTGKIERRHLATLLGLDRPHEQPSFVAPRDALEGRVADMWQHVLELDHQPSVDMDFFDVGGDSLHATELLLEVERQFGRPLDATIFFHGATVRTMSDALREPEASVSHAQIVPVQPHGSLPPLFCLMQGGAVIAARNFSADLGPDRPIYGIWYPQTHGPRDVAGSVEDIAAACTDAIRTERPVGPFFLFGHSFGGVVMYEVAQQLARGGHDVGLLVLADAHHPRFVTPELTKRYKVWRRRIRKLVRRRGAVKAAGQRARQTVTRARPVSFVPGSNIPHDVAATTARERAYRPVASHAPVAIFSTKSFRDKTQLPDLGWADLLRGDWTCDQVPGTHRTMIAEPSVHVLAAKLAVRVDEAQRRLTSGDADGQRARAADLAP